MTDILHPLLLDLVEWIAKEPRLYSEVLEAWRTSCPRLTVWEDAVDRGYVAREPFDGRAASVKVTPLGYAFLQQNGLSRPWSSQPSEHPCVQPNRAPNPTTLVLYNLGGIRLMNPNKALWEKGDFTQLAATMRESGDDLVASLGVEKGMDVLDLGCGDGTTALPAAERGANVLGVDIAANLVAAGRARAAAAGLANLRFEEGDASDLPGINDNSFDLVVSMFGAMFAPRPFDVAREMVRVTRSRGRIVMGNWIPGDPTLVAQILKISAAYTPPPPEGFISPVTWGVEDNVRERFGAAGIPARERILRARQLRFPPFGPAGRIPRTL